MDIYPGPLTQDRDYLISEDLKTGLQLIIVRGAEGSSAIAGKCDPKLMPFLNGRPLTRCVYANEITGCALVYKTNLDGSIFVRRIVAPNGVLVYDIPYTWVRGNIELRLVG